MTAPAGDWLSQAHEYAERTGADPRFIFMWLLTEIDSRNPGAVAAALAALPPPRPLSPAPELPQQ